MYKTIGLAVVAALALMTIVIRQQVQQPSVVVNKENNGVRIEWHNCNSLLYSQIPVDCGRYYPAGDSGAFYLPFVIFRYRDADANADPLVYVAGGPGDGLQTHADSMQSWAYWLEDLELKRDFIIFDQRGLKPGKPYWDCETYNEVSLGLLAENLSLEQEYKKTPPILHRCLHQFDQWLRSPVVGVSSGLKSFSSLSGAANLNGMLTALGYRQWSLWGVSYGTRLALVAAQQNPSGVSAMILDSPYPLDRGRLSERPKNYARALNSFWTLCQHNAEFCGVEVGDPEALFWRVVDRLQKQPVTYKVKDPYSSSTVNFVLNGHRLFSLAHFALYDPRLYSDLLRGLVLLDGGEVTEPDMLEPIAFLLNLFVASAFDNGFNSLIFYAIECNDNPLEPVDIYRKAAMAEALLYPFLAFEEDYNPCRSPLFTEEALLSTEPAPTAPALLLVGELDPVTPVIWAESLAQRLPQAKLIVAPQTGHAVFASGVCDVSLIKQFLLTPLTSVDELNKYCHQ